MVDDTLTLELLAGLMKQDTVNPPGNEKNGALYLKSVFDKHGIESEIQDLGDNRANFIAEIGQGDKIVEFSGHLDVVPCIGDWHYPAVGYTKVGDRLYGRGACDMKGGIAAMCATAIAFHEAKLPLNGRIRLVFVADEEQANLGMHTFQNTHPAADYTILGEPTNLHVAVAHRGVVRYYIDLEGRSCHAALRSNEVTSVAKTSMAIKAIDVLNEKLQEITHRILPSPSIVITMIQGYEKDNVVPGSIRLLVDFRILPGMTENQTRTMIDDALKSQGITGYRIVEHFFMPGGEIVPEHPFVGVCLEKAAELNNREEKVLAFGASCEQCFLVEKGSATVIIGPGSLEQAHIVNEFVEIEQVKKAAHIYGQIAMEMLK